MTHPRARRHLRMTARVAVFACVVVLLLFAAMPGAGDDSGAPKPQARVTSSLQVGEAFDESAKQIFLEGVTETERARLVMLRSRFELADATSPLPAPGRPFYLKLRGDMTRELSGRILSGGGRFLGYAYPHTHIVRAPEAGMRHRLQGILASHQLVAGTVQQRIEDKLSAGSAAEVLNANGGEFCINFWRDVTVGQAVELLAQARATVLEAATDDDGSLSLRSPWINVAVDHEGLAALLDSDLLELITPAAWAEITNAVSTNMSSANAAAVGGAPYNLDGTDQVVGVWDGGTARDTHQDFQNAPSPSLINNGTRRVRRMNTNSAAQHPTHVTGTIVGDGTGNANARGYAPRALALSYNWSNVDTGRRNARHDYNHVSDNHSYANFSGSQGDWGQYTSATQLKDYSNRDVLLIMCQSAGNYASNPPSGVAASPYPNGSVTIPAANCHRNGLIIGAVQDNTNITSFSSKGPGTDGRLAPQFCANGAGLTSPSSGSDTSYASLSGTSMSGPSVCGTTTLLSQLWRREHNDQLLPPDVARAILALTCQDKGPTGPDYTYGFGIVDCKAAADVILDDRATNGSRIVRGQLRSGEVVDYTVQVNSSSEPLKVVLSWLDIWASTSAQITLVNDLDIELVSPLQQVHYPYSGLLAGGDAGTAFTTTGPNRRDNIELAVVENPAVGAWTVRVRGFSIPGNPQNDTPNDVIGFVLATSHDVQVQKVVVQDALNGTQPVAIPDNSATGVVRTLSVSDPRVATGIRVYARIKHDRRGDLEIMLEHPDSTMITLEGRQSHFDDTYKDIIAVYPDTRQNDDDVTALLCRHVAGDWKIHVRDRASGNSGGTIEWLALELDLRNNTPPHADAGADQTVRDGDTVQLGSGPALDVDGDTVFYSWQQTAGALNVQLAGASTPSPTFMAPPVTQDETLAFTLTTSDCSGAFTTDTVLVTIKLNIAPVANAGSDFALFEGEHGQLDGSASFDAEGDPITFQWVQTGGTPALALSGADSANPTFTAPQVQQDTTLTFELTVTDDRGAFSTDSVLFTIRNNLAPIASAGADIQLVEGAPGQLDASASFDPEGAPLTFDWVQVAGSPTIVLAAANVATPTFTAPPVTFNVSIELQVTVTDALGLTATDSVRILIEANLPPIANAGTDRAVKFGVPVQLSGTASSDVNTGDSLTFSWAQTGGTATINLSGADTAQPTFTSPGAADKLQFTLTVTDRLGLQSSAIVTIHVNKDGRISTGASPSDSESSCTLVPGRAWGILALLPLLALRRRRRPTVLRTPKARL